MPNQNLKLVLSSWIIPEKLREMFSLPAASSTFGKIGAVSPDHYEAPASGGFQPFHFSRTNLVIKYRNRSRSLSPISMSTIRAVATSPLMTTCSLR